MSQKDELIHRATAKRKELEAELERLKAEGRANVDEQVTRLQERVESLRTTIDEARSKWTESAAQRLNDWLKKF